MLAYDEQPAQPAVIFCSDGGVLAQASPGPAGSQAQQGDEDHAAAQATILYQEPCASITSFDLENAAAFCVTDQECLLYHRRPRTVSML